MYCGAQARKIIPNVKKLLDREIKKGAEVFFLADRHAEDDLEFEMFPPHCIEGTSEAEVIDELSSYNGEIIPKARYSGFFDTELGKKLEKLNPDKLIICGVCTDICVLHTVAEARNRDYKVEVPANCVASFNEKAHKFALEHKEKVLGAEVTAKETLEESKFAPSEAVLKGDTADIYFSRTIEVLEKENLNPRAVMEVFPNGDGILCGVEETLALLKKVLPEGESEVWALKDGEPVNRKEVALRISAPYVNYGLYETAICGILAASTGWCTAARECVLAADGIPVISFGARHVHPSVVGVMDHAAIVGGCKGCSSVIGARLAGIKASGTIPHALIITMGDTVLATIAFDKHMPEGVPRVALVDTFRDEAEESLRVAQALKKNLSAVRLDTPRERGGVTPELVKEVRARLDQAGFKDVGIFISGGLTPERIREHVEQGAPIKGFGTGSYISGAKPIDFTADLHEINGKAVAKRGRIPGITENPRLKRVL